MKKIFFFLVLIQLFYSCKKDLIFLPIVTSEVVQITEYAASARCSIVSDGVSEIIRYGLFYGTPQDPETDGTDMEIVVSDSFADVESFELILGDYVHICFLLTDEAGR